MEENITKPAQITAELTDAENQFYKEQSDLLATREGVSKVHPVVQIDPETLDRKVCYLREPNYATKITVMDKAITIGVYKAADELREACLIKDASDAITYSDHSDSDRYKMGVTDYCMGMITRLQNQFKKK